MSLRDLGLRGVSFWQSLGSGKAEGEERVIASCRLATGHAAMIRPGLPYPSFLDFSLNFIRRIFTKETTLQPQLFRYVNRSLSLLE